LVLVPAVAPAAGPEPAGVLFALGLLTAFAGVALGLGQSGLKTVLAYSTVSQMGLVLCGYATLAFVPGIGPSGAVVGLVALHHGLNKAALFLAAGSAPGASRLRMALTVLPALSLAAAPLSTGFLAKAWLGRSVQLGIDLGTLPGVAYTVLALTSAATALLMGRALRLAARERVPDGPIHPAWPALTLAAITLPWVWAARHELLIAPTIASVWAATWPLLLAATLLGAALRLRVPGVALPPGDVLVPIERTLRGVREPAVAPDRRRPATGAWIARTLATAVGVAEARLRELPAVGLVLLALGGLLWLVSVVW
jgi:formate hydrogenlyase subunit 3/multisubunit Na+/H+ antiporter MnhD subunit